MKTSKNRRGLPKRKIKELEKKVDENDFITYRRISALRIVGSRRSTPIDHTYTPPEFRVEVSGFWRNLPNPESEGKDPAGNPIKGRTWVKQHIRWRDKPQRDKKVVYIKSRLSPAKRIADFEKNYRVKIISPIDSIKGVSSASEYTSKKKNEGFVYILTNAALGTDIFKVGQTTRNPEERAKEISSSTGVPVPFLVAEYWSVTDVHAAERAAHSSLENHRINTAREFFNIPFNVARRTVENAINDYIKP